LTQEDLESIGRDICRTLLVYENIYTPVELKDYLKDNEDVQNINDFKTALKNELI